MDGASASTSAVTAEQEFAGTRTEWVELMAACLREAGWEVQVTNDPTTTEAVIESEVPVGQDAAYQDAGATCEESLPIRPEPDSDEELQEAYDNEVTRHECMVEAGFSSAPPPSFATWLEAIRSGAVSWTPEDGVADADLEGAIRACPRDPEAWW